MLMMGFLLFYKFETVRLLSPETGVLRIQVILSHFLALEIESRLPSEAAQVSL